MEKTRTKGKAGNQKSKTHLTGEENQTCLLEKAVKEKRSWVQGHPLPICWGEESKGRLEEREVRKRSSFSIPSTRAKGSVLQCAVLKKREVKD